MQDIDLKFKERQREFSSERKNLVKKKMELHEENIELKNFLNDAENKIG